MLGRTPLAVGLVIAASAWGQSVISAHSGVIHLAEGQVTVDGTEVHQKFGEFGDVKMNQTLATQDGRAEVLLTPGVFLRVGENSSFKMVSNKLDDTRIEVINGTAMIQVSQLLEGNAITLISHDSTIELQKKGLYRVDADQNRFRVYDGEAQVISGEKKLTAKKGHEVELGAELVAKGFDTKDTDAFYRWNERRDEYISEANVYAAKSARDSGFGYTGSGYNMAYGAGMGSWMWNPWFGMFTYMPYNGMFYSPFGFGYYSPVMVGYLYMPGSPYYYGGTGIANSGIVTRNSGLTTRNGLTTGASAVTRGGGTTGGLGMAGAHGGGPAMGGGGGASSGGHGFGGGGGGGIGGAGGHAGGGGGHR
jgi:hypothetical protein